ncbi:MAG: hypothetical protein ACTHKY_19865 [Ginsengibacter sp.]
MILYKSKYAATRQYAAWLAERLAIPQKMRTTYQKTRSRTMTLSLSGHLSISENF